MLSFEQIQKEQDKHFSSARAPTPWWVQSYNNLQVRELHPHFKLALVVSQRCLPNEMTATAIIIFNLVTVRLLSEEPASLLEWNFKWGGGRDLRKPLPCMLSSIMTQSHFPGLYFLIHFSAEVPSVFQLPSLLHVLVMRRSPSLVALPHNPPTGSPRGRGNPSSRTPEA